MFNFISAEHIAVMIPIFMVFAAVIIVIVAIIVGAKNKELEHKERVLYLEKGIPIPEKPSKRVKPGYVGKRTGGLVFVAIGLGVMIANWVVAGAIAGVWGLIPLFIGIGLLIAASLDKREYLEQEGQEHAS
jgi:cadmium resistance protein CadD (predicted permease)